MLPKRSQEVMLSEELPKRRRGNLRDGESVHHREALRRRTLERGLSEFTTMPWVTEFRLSFVRSGLRALPEQTQDLAQLLHPDQGSSATTKI